MPLTQTHLASMTSMASLRSTVGTVLRGSTVGTVLRATIGPARTRALAARLTPATPPPLAPKSRFRPSEAFVPAPKATVTHYAFLRGIHERLEPRTYVEVGVRHGDSLALSRARSVGIDPAFSITAELQCDVQLVRSTSDEFFARPHAFDFFEGVPVDFAFIDGMHLAEFAFRDFLGVEPAMASTGIIALDDMLPRNGLEAARDRLTQGWAGDVFKVVEVLRRHRPDLVIVLVNTRPTGTALVFGVDPTWSGADDVIAAETPYFLAVDPQTPPQHYLDRTVAVAPETVLSSSVWDVLVAERENPTPDGRARILDEVRSWPTLDPVE